MEKLEWMEWSVEAFQRAKQEDKLVLLDIGAIWCHWCHVMDEESYSNPDIIQIINEEYVPIRVDNDERPDINDRYNQGGWPTTVILTPEGYVVQGATYLPPTTLKELLKQAKEWYIENRERLAEAASAMASALLDGIGLPPAEPETVTDFSEALIEDIQKNGDPIHGGFGTSAKLPQPGAITLLFAMHHATGDESLLEFAEKTLHNMSEGLLDHQEGGLFRYSVTREWNAPHYEKNLDVNADCLRNYLDAYRITGKKEYTETAEKIIRYLMETLSDQTRGGFYGSQDADIFDEEKQKIVMDGEKYYKLSSEEREKHGVPFIDRTIYTNSNALMISAFLEAYHALGREDCREFALKTLRFLMESCCDNDYGVSHYLRDGTVTGSGLLTDFVALARADLDAYETTGNSSYLEHAERLMGVVYASLRAEDGGFYDSMIDETMPPATHIRNKPINGNALAAEVLARLYSYTTTPEYLEQARLTLAAFRKNIEAMLARNVGYFASDLAIAARFADDAATKVVIIGFHDDPKSRALLHEVKRMYLPVKIVQFLDPVADADLIQLMDFPASESAVAYVCVGKKCGRPITEVKELRRIIKAL